MIVNDFKRMVKRFVKRAVGDGRPIPQPALEPAAKVDQPAADQVLSLIAKVDRLEAEKPTHIIAGITNAILYSSSEAYFECVLNDCPLLLPRDMLRTMVHCIQGGVPGPIFLYVETQHYKWLASKVQKGEIFLDVGAATGTMALPMAKLSVGVDKVIAFEPAMTVNRRLREVVKYNKIGNIEVVDSAVSNLPGTVSFSEYGFDETGVTPYLPEASAITSRLIDPSRSRSYEVPVTTIDAFMANRADIAIAKVMKIDVEGFEVHVLEGARDFIRRVKPHIAIDIHRNPFHEGTTEQPVREFLGKFGYEFTNMDHVLLCTPV